MSWRFGTVRSFGSAEWYGDCIANPSEEAFLGWLLSYVGTCREMKTLSNFLCIDDDENSSVISLVLSMYRVAE
uniref:Uncharacterized protein n=1 Tax=Peronospora matthiolae TaxID=2874970 RepID=A0AAV1TIX3_9STRA